uniref:Lipase member N n=1 Tax=Aceria tosichella TaxID=561515 RepID=A0A6G1S4G4_9ACAR
MLVIANLKLSMPYYLLVSLVLIIIISTHYVYADDFFEGPGVSAAEILRGRGFIADELYVETNSGYVLRLTRGRNPLIKGGSLRSKDPVLFIHGVLASANNFLLYSQGAEPRDFTNMSLVDMDLDELIERLADEPSAKSLPLLALNCGHEVWLLDRRGVPGSQQLIGDSRSIKTRPDQDEDSSQFGSILGYINNLFSGYSFVDQFRLTLDQRYWNYSLDEQARDDFPVTIDFILDNSPGASRVSVVGHSAGGAITLMALSLYPNELTSKISSCILWSPAYATGNDNPGFISTFEILLPIGSAITGPLPPPFLTIPAQTTLMLICSPPPTWTTLCKEFVDAQAGDSGGQQPAKPFLFASEYFSSSSHELVQLGQNINYPNKTVHAYDYGEAGNQAAYGQPTPPAYDLSVLTEFSSMSFYAGGTDTLVTPADVEQARAQLRVPSEYHKINTTFNHVGYFSHVDAPRLAIIPSMRELETLARK